MAPHTKRHTTNTIFDKQQTKLVKATFKKGIIIAVHPTAATADVAFAENPANIIRNIPLAGTINPLLIMPSDKCRIDLFSEINTADMVVAYTYGRALGSTIKIFTTTGSFGGGGSTTLTIPHHLGVKPDIYCVMPTSDWFYGPGPATYGLDIIADATNITLSKFPNNVISMGYYVFAVVF